MTVFDDHLSSNATHSNDSSKGLDWTLMRSDSLVHMALYDPRSLFQRHPSESWYDADMANKTLTDVLNMSDDLLLTGLEEPRVLMNAPIIELPDAVGPVNTPEPYGCVSGVPAHLVTPSRSSRETRSVSLSSFNIDDAPRFRDYQAGQWSQKFDELCEYRRTRGDCLVPHRYKANPSLGRWVKRQRYQYKLWKSGQPSTMTQDRARVLESIGFVWDSQGACWEERLDELKRFKDEYGHCNVPSLSTEYPKLATWIKCQRRQYKLFQDGQPSNITAQRINELEKLGLQWEIRGTKRRTL